MGSTEFNYGPDDEAISDAYGKARGEIGSQEDVAGALQTTSKTVGSYEKKPVGRKANALRYARYLVENSESGAELFAELIGLEPRPDTLPSDIRRIVERLKELRESPEWSRKLIAVEVALGMGTGGQARASSNGGKSGDRGEQSAAAS